MDITRKYWIDNIQTRFNEPPNLILDTELIEFGTKALDKIEQLQAENDDLCCELSVLQCSSIKFEDLTEDSGVKEYIEQLQDKVEKLKEESKAPNLSKAQRDLLCALEELWSTHPAERFSQLLSNHTRFGTRACTSFSKTDSGNTGLIADIFFYLNSEILADLKRGREKV
ncbi:hypothetical protein LCGC14_0360040 [marine sediment metagenome]|uniref:Uncharacterized protein n=1 Tax=marine sediment metagenome TaxID=412755 RepID=A0A0F9T8B4_9ZZZZ